MTSRNIISIILPDLRNGGAEHVNLDLAKGFVQRGFNVEFVLRQEQGELLGEARQIGSIVDLKARRVREATRPLATYLKERRPSAVLASMWPLTVATIRARTMSGHDCAVVLAEHGVLSHQYASWGRLHNLSMRLSLRYAARRADGIVCVSSGVADDLASITGQPPDRFSVIYNPVSPPTDPTEADRATAESMWQGAQGKRIITVGRLKAVKNHALLIDALALLDDAQTQLMIVGDGELRGKLEQHVHDKGVAGRVIFAGYQANPSPFYTSADLFVLSSWSEGFGNVIVEAMGHGLPVASTDCPTGPGEILQGGRFGWLTPPGDSREMAAAMSQALITPIDSHQQIAHAAQFRPEFAIDSYLRLLFPEGAERSIARI